jgi:chaperonin GroEL
VRLGDHARQRLLRGINLVARAVKVTLGPKGRTVLIEKSVGAPRITKDGLSVARVITLPDKFENMGAQLLLEVAAKTSELAGDGSTTAAVLTQAIVLEGVRGVAAGLNPTDIKRGIDQAMRAITDDLKGHTKEIATLVELARIGTIAANGETDIGNMISEAIEKVGNEGIITLEESKSVRTEIDVIEGMQFTGGYVSSRFITNSEKMLVELDNPYILIHEKKVSSLEPTVRLLEMVVQMGRPLLIIAEDTEGEALETLIINKVRAGLKVAAVKVQGIGGDRYELLDILEDIAVMTGGEVITEGLGIQLDTVSFHMLGQAKRVLIDQRHTTIVGGAGSPEDIEYHCQHIRAQFKKYKHKKLLERLAKFAGGVAVIRVGGSTEVEVRERKDRVEDALHATRAAIEEGILPGGGVALARASGNLAQLKPENEGQSFGIEIVRKAVQSPLRQIAENAGEDGGVVASKVLENRDYNFGFDAQTAEFKDLMSAGIVDATKVVRIAAQNAASVAGLLITAQAAIGSLGEDTTSEPIQSQSADPPSALAKSKKIEG